MEGGMEGGMEGEERHKMSNRAHAGRMMMSMHTPSCGTALGGMRWHGVARGIHMQINSHLVHLALVAAHAVGGGATDHGRRCDDCLALRNQRRVEGRLRHATRQHATRQMWQCNRGISPPSDGVPRGLLPGRPSLPL